MRIAIDATAAVRQWAGVGRFARGLLSGLGRLDAHNEYICLTFDRPRIQLTSERLPARCSWRRLPIPERAATLLWQRWRLAPPPTAFTGPVSLYFTPDYALPRVGRTPAIVTVHDLSFMIHPECADARLRRYLMHVVPRSVASAAAVVAVSHTTANAVHELLGVPRERIHVVPNGVDAALLPSTLLPETTAHVGNSGLPSGALPDRDLGFQSGEPQHVGNPGFQSGEYVMSGLAAGFNPLSRPAEYLPGYAHSSLDEQLRARFGLDPGYLLAVSTLEPRKNYVRLLEAFARVRRRIASERGSSCTLVIVGREGWLYEPIFRAVARLGLGSAVRFLTRADDDDLRWLYSGAHAYVYPSIYEGFGIPPLEAMANGIPVAASTGGALPEVLGDAAYLFDPFDVDAIARALERIMLDEPLRAALAQRGRDRAAAYTWDAAAQAALALFHRVAA